MGGGAFGGKAAASLRAVDDVSFDLMAGEMRTIVVRNEIAGLAPSDLSVRTLLRHA